ncbi:MAG: hypothetical protein INQ03_17655 [Candidatus Heimdallarchaeota archaeon]|nr:hypothetical protein [Candidatus Heimdallarchaeota archaeon]
MKNLKFYIIFTMLILGVQYSSSILNQDTLGLNEIGYISNPYPAFEYIDTDSNGNFDFLNVSVGIYALGQREYTMDMYFYKNDSGDYIASTYSQRYISFQGNTTITGIFESEYLYQTGYIGYVNLFGYVYENYNANSSYLGVVEYTFWLDYTLFDLPPAIITQQNIFYRDLDTNNVTSTCSCVDIIEIVTTVQVNEFARELEFYTYGYVYSGYFEYHIDSINNNWIYFYDVDVSNFTFSTYILPKTSYQNYTDILLEFYTYGYHYDNNQDSTFIYDYYLQDSTNGTKFDSGLFNIEYSTPMPIDVNNNGLTDHFLIDVIINTKIPADLNFYFGFDFYSSSLNIWKYIYSETFEIFNTTGIYTFNTTLKVDTLYGIDLDSFYNLYTYGEANFLGNNFSLRIDHSLNNVPFNHTIYDIPSVYLTFQQANPVYYTSPLYADFMNVTASIHAPQHSYLDMYFDFYSPDNYLFSTYIGTEWYQYEEWADISVVIPGETLYNTYYSGNITMYVSVYAYDYLTDTSSYIYLTFNFGFNYADYNPNGQISTTSDITTTTYTTSVSYTSTTSDPTQTSSDTQTTSDPSTETTNQNTSETTTDPTTTEDTSSESNVSTDDFSTSDEVSTSDTNQNSETDTNSSGPPAPTLPIPAPSIFVSIFSIGFIILTIRRKSV